MKADPGDHAGGPKDEGSFFSYKIVGPVTVTHALIGVGVVGGLWYMVKKGIFRRWFGG